MALRYEIYQALGDPTRLELIERLGSQGPIPTGDLVSGLGMSRQAATKHLLILEKAGLVASRTEGRVIYRELQVDALADAGDWLAARAVSWGRKLQALARFVEGGLGDP